MATGQEQGYESLLQSFLQDLNGDGIPDGMQVDSANGTAVSNRERGMIQRRAMAGREPSGVDQARLRADMPRLEGRGNDLAQTLAGLGIDLAVPLPVHAAMEVMRPSPAQGGGPSQYGPATDAQLQAEAELNAERRESDPSLFQRARNALFPEAWAQSVLTKRQQREQEMQNLEQQRQVQAERDRAMAAAEVEAQRRRQEIEIEKERQRAERQSAEEAELARGSASRRPWRERNPEIAGALPAVGYGLAAAVPAAGAIVRNVASRFPGSAASRMNRAADQGEALLMQPGRASAADMREVGLRRDQITNYMENQPSEVRNFLMNRLIPAAAGGVLAYEGRVFPDQMDMRDVNLTGEQRQEARANVYSGGGLVENVMFGGLTGLSAQEAVDRVLPAKTPDEGRARAVRDRLQRYRRR